MWADRRLSLATRATVHPHHLLSYAGIVACAEERRQQDVRVKFTVDDLGLPTRNATHSTLKPEGCELLTGNGGLIPRQRLTA